MTSVDRRDLAAHSVATERFPAYDVESRSAAVKERGRRVTAFAAGSVLVVGAVAALHNIYRSGDSTTDLIGWAGLLLLAMTALGGGIKLALWGAKPVTDAGFAAVKAKVPESVQAVAASGAVIAGALGMWWVFRGGYAAWWQHFSGEAGWSLTLGVGQMLVAVLAGAALFTGGKYLTGLTKEVLTDAGVLLERDRTSGSSGASEGVWHPGLVAALIGGGLGLVLLTAGITPRLYVWITGPDVLPAVGAITFVLLWAIGSNLGWWKGLGGLYNWPTDASQKAAATAGVVAVLMFSAGGLGLGWFTPATVPQAHAACPPDCGGPGGSDGPPGGGQQFQPPQMPNQMPDYQSSNSGRPALDQNNGLSIYNQQPSQGANASTPNNGSPQQGVQSGQNADGSWQRAANGEQIPNYQNATPYTQGPGAPNPEYNGGQANPGTQGGNQGATQQQPPANQGQQPGQSQSPRNNSGQQPNQSSDQQKIDDLTRQLQDQQQQSGQDRQRLDDLTKQLQQQNKQNKKQDLPRFPSKDDKKDRDQQDRDKQSGNNDLAALLMGAASTRRRKQDEQEQGPDTQALGQDASQAAQGLPGDVQTYVQSGQQIGQASGQAAQGFGSAAQAGASLASSAQSGAVNPQDAITMVQGVSQGIQGTADAVNAGSQIVKTAQKEADQAAQAVGDANPQLKPQMQQVTELNDQASQVTDLVGQGAQLTSQGAGAVNTVSGLGAGGVPDGGGTAEAMSGPTNAAAEVQSVELMSGPVPQDVPGGDAEPAAPVEPPPSPRITNSFPTTDPITAENKPVMTDLDTTTPGWGHTVKGDARQHYPQIDGSDNPYRPSKLPGDTDNRRPLPTGVGRGKADQPLVAYNTPQYGQPETPTQQEFTTPDTEVWDYSNIGSPRKVGNLKGISQGSVFYNKAEQQMVVVGNQGAQSGAPRGLWTAPVDDAKPDDWVNHLSFQDVIPGGGDRENQYYPLKGGGVLLVDAANGGGVRAFAAGNTQGLLNGATRSDQLIAQGMQPGVLPPIPADAPEGSTWNYQVAYGASVVNDVVNGTTETVTLRTSAWAVVQPPPGGELPQGFDNYFPYTFLYDVVIEHPLAPEGS